jgi:hypothetical protein
MAAANHFESPRLTILRAQYHIDDLNAKIVEFVSNQPWSYRIDQDVPARQDLHKIKFERRLPSQLPCIVFDAVNNMRAVLDQAGYASSVASGRQTPKRTNFPFADDLTGLNNNIDGRKVCDHLPAEIVTLFRGFNPYQGGNDTLWAMNKLCNSKKHCALAPFDFGRAQLSETVISKKPISVVKEGDFYKVSYAAQQSGFVGGMSGKNADWDPDKYEITLARLPLNTSTNYEANVSLNIAIEGIEALRGKPAVAVLSDMMSVVDSILSATEAECRRLGLL